MDASTRSAPAALRWSRKAAVILILAATLAVALSAGGAFVLRGASARGRIGPQAYEQLREGMHRTEVEAAVGLPPGDHRDRAHRPGGRLFTEWAEEEAAVEFGGAAADRLHWQGNDYSIAAGFDEAGTVRWKTLWRHVPPTPRDPADAVRRRLGW
jgi:hypothetical protein